MKDCFSFFLEFGAFYGLTLVYALLLALYRFKWTLVYKNRLWVWQLRTTFLIRRHSLEKEKPAGLSESLSREKAHREYKIHIAFKKSQAAVDSYQPSVCKSLYNKIKSLNDPFLNPFWIDMQV